ncbi:MAG TPA: hypothetical protein VFV99_32350 [Kofleriaceae bacterium]|nr:hypothetical protein [Kofleriaceae bacterium]
MTAADYKRSLYPVEGLLAGEWTDETATGRPAVCCARCSGIYDIPETHRIDPAGFVRPELKCGAGCSEVGYGVRLLNYADEVLR